MAPFVHFFLLHSFGLYIVLALCFEHTFGAFSRSWMHTESDVIKALENDFPWSWVTKLGHHLAASGLHWVSWLSTPNQILTLGWGCVAVISDSRTIVGASWRKKLITSIQNFPVLPYFDLKGHKEWKDAATITEVSVKGELTSEPSTHSSMELVSHFNKSFLLFSFP